MLRINLFLKQPPDPLQSGILPTKHIFYDYYLL